MGIWLIVGGMLAGLLLLSKKAEAAAKGLTVIPTTEIVTPAKYPYQAEVASAAAKYNVSPYLIAAVVSWEQRSDTRWDPNAVNPSDPSYGLGQVTPYIGKRFGILSSESDHAALFVPQKNLYAVAAFLNYLLHDMKHSVDDAIQIYNLGEPKFWDGLRVPAYLAGVNSYLRKFRGW